MDVTPQVINEVEFHQKMRGYDPDEVDDFLERISMAVAQLTERLHDAEARAATADRRALELERKAREQEDRPAPINDDETETIKRTLVLAQRTADAAIKEAQEEAQHTVASAQEHADTLLSEAHATSRRLVTEAEVDARKASEDTRRRVAAELVALEATRDALKADHGILERHLEEQRLRLRSSIGDLQRLLDDPARLRAANSPELSGATRPTLMEDELEAGAATPAPPKAARRPKPPAPPVSPEPPASSDHEAVIDLDAAEAAAAASAPPAGNTDAPLERPVTGGVRFTAAEEAVGAQRASAGRTALATDDGDTDAWTRFVREEMVDRPTQAVAMPQSEEAYLTDLRRSMDASGAGEADSEGRASKGRFGRRR